jgi:hypothetical protein
MILMATWEMCTAELVFNDPGEALWQQCTKVEMAFTSWHDEQWKASTRPFRVARGTAS